MDIGPRHIGKPEYEESRQERSEKYSCRGKYQSGCDDRSYRGHAGRHAAREEDDAQGYHADELGVVHIAELESEAICAEGHAHEKEYEQKWQAGAIARFTDKYSGNK